MPTFRVATRIELLATYTVKAETEDEAQQIAIERANDGIGWHDGDIMLVDVDDVWDETEEFE